MTDETTRTGALAKNWRWMIVVGAAVVVATVAGLLVWGLSAGTESAQPVASPSSSATPRPSASGASASPSATAASPSPTDIEGLVDVGALGLVGRSASDAARIVTDNRLSSQTRDAGYALSEAQVGVVVGVSPQGYLSPGSVVTLLVYGPMAAMRIPPEPFVVYGTDLASTVPAGATLKVVTLREESCATSTGALTAHTFTANLGRFANGDRQITTSEPTGDVPVVLVVDADAAGQKLEVRVATTCTNDVGERTSDFSRPKIVSIAGP